MAVVDMVQRAKSEATVARDKGQTKGLSEAEARQRLGWRLALLVWGYTLVSFGVASAVKIGVYRLIDYRAARYSRYLQRIEGSIRA